MKTSLNKIMLFSFLLAFILTLLCIYSLYSNNEVGAIKKDSKLGDHPDFKLSSRRIYQYYQVSTSYEGGRNALRKEFFPLVKQLDINKQFSGYITTRFIVNYKGETDRFRVKCITVDFKEVILEKPIQETLISSIRTLKNWIPGKSKSIFVDSYYQITLKITKGEIIDIF